MLKLIEGNPVWATTVLVAIAMVIVAWIVGKDAQYAVIQFQPVTYDGIVDLMTPIVLVAIFMERALEVFVATGRKLGRGEKERALQKARNKLEQLDERLKAFQAQLDAPGAAQLSAAAKKEIHDRMQNVANLVPTEQREERHADSALEAYRVVTSRISFVVGSLFGLIIGLAGLRAVAPLVDLDAVQWSNFQEFVFHSLDVVLTAGLLAGGASGIHQVVRVFGDFTDQTRRKAQA